MSSDQLRDSLQQFTSEIEALKALRSVWEDLYKQNLFASLQELNEGELKEEKVKKVRIETVREIFTTETNYVRYLNVIVDSFLVPLQEKKILKPEEIKTIFSNIGEILAAHKKFLEELSPRMENFDVETSLIGDLFIKWAPSLKVYSSYFANYENAIVFSTQLRFNNPNFNTSFQSLKDPGSHLDLSDYLIMPIQRLPRYVMLIKEVIKNTKESHPDFKNLNQGLEKMQEVTYIVDMATPELKASKSANFVTSFSPQTSVSKRGRKDSGVDLSSLTKKFIPKNKKSKNQFPKLVNEIVEITKLDKKYVIDALDKLFPDGTDYRSLQISESDFISLFEGKLGTASIMKRMFSLFSVPTGSIRGNIDSLSRTSISPIDFFKFVALFELPGSIEEKLKAIFQAYDDDGGGALEFNELKALASHMESVLIGDGEEPHVARNTVSAICKKLDPNNSGTVSFENFLKVGKERNELIQFLISRPLLTFEHDSMIINVNDEHLNEATASLFKLVRQGNTVATADKLKVLLEKSNIDFDVVDWNGETLLHHAVVTTNPEALKLLLSKGASVDKRYGSGRTVLHTAAETGEIDILTILLDNSANINSQDDIGRTPLHRAMRAQKDETGSGIWKCIVELVNRGANLHLVDRDGCTILDMCARYGQPEHLEFLVDRGAAVNRRGPNGFTPLHWAANVGSATCIKKLCTLGADPNLTSSSGSTPLHLAAQLGAVNCLERLLEDKNIKPCIKDNLGRTPLHLATDPRCVRLLIKVAPEALKIRDEQGNLPEDSAHQKGANEAYKIMKDGPLQEQSEFSKTLLASFRKGDNDKVLKLLKQPKADVHAANENGTTLLHYAAMQGRDDILQLLLSKGANPNIGNNRGTTPLHKAPQRGELKCLKILLGAGANINAQDDDDVTPLHRALYELGSGQNSALKIQKISECINELLTCKAKLNLSDKEGCFPLDLAAKFGLSEHLKAFITAGGDIHHKSKNRFTPLHWAAFGGHADCIATLIAFNAHINESNIEEKLPTPLMLAAKNGHKAAFSLLISSGVDTSFQDHLGNTVLHWAAWNGSSEIFSLILAKNSSLLNAKNNSGDLPIHLVRTSEVLQILVSNGSDINSKNQNNETPLQTTTRIHGSVSLIEKFISLEADLNHKNKFGETALYIASRNGFEDCIKLFLEKGLKFYEQEQSDQIKYLPGPIYPKIAAGTIDKLIDHLCNEKFFDNKFVEEFLYTYRMYVGPQALLDKIIDRHKKLKLDYPQNIELKSRNFNSPYLPPGPLSVLLFWIKHHHEDFSYNIKLRENLLTFIRQLGAAGKTLEFELTEKIERSNVRKPRVKYLNRSLSQQGTTKRVLDLTKYSADLIAQQLTLIDTVTFRAIETDELANWDSSHPSQTPTTSSYMKRFTLVQSWVKYEIVNQERRTVRGKLIQKFIAIAQCCYKLNNFQTSLAILYALDSPSISRLQKTWKEVGKASIQSLLKIKEVFKSDENYKNYREAIQKVQNSPCIPFLGVNLEDLTTIDENQPTLITENNVDLINFVKMAATADVMAEIHHFQKQENYEIEENAEIVLYLLSLPAITEKEAAEKSSKIEPPK